MKVGISTGCFFPQKTHQALERAGKLGAKNVEIFFNTHSELTQNYIENLKQIINKYCMNVISIHPYTSAIETFMFFSLNDYKLDDSISLYEKYFSACQQLGGKYIVFHGCFNNNKYMNMQRYCDNLNKLSKKAREYGVYISQENVFKYKCGYMHNIQEFVKYADNDVKFTFDIKQAIKAKQSIYKILECTKNRISHLHISDYALLKHSMIPFTGRFNYDKFFKYIKENTTAEAALIEVYSNIASNEKELDNQLLQALRKTENVLDKYY